MQFDRKQYILHPVIVTIRPTQQIHVQILLNLIDLVQYDLARMRRKHFQSHTGPKLRECFASFVRSVILLNFFITRHAKIHNTRR